MDTCETNHAQFHNEMVYEFLDLFLCVCAVAKVSFRIDIEECGVTTNGHSSTVLLFNSTKIAEVNPLHSFTNILSWFGNIIAIGCCHLFQFFQRANLILYFLTVANNIF